MKILLAEQSRAVALALRRLLEGKGHSVETAYDGVQALDCLQKDAFDLLIAEMDLPRIDGRALIKCLTTRGKWIPTIGILPTSEVSKEDLTENVGIEALLPKPYPTEALLSLAEMLGRESRDIAGLSFWQRKLLEALSEKDAVTMEELSAILPEPYGTVRAFLSSTNDILARGESGKRIVPSEKGYKVVAV